MNYAKLRGDQRRCLALTGLTPSEFDLLLPAFSRSCERLYPADRTVAGHPRQRFPGGGRTGALHEPGQKLLFLLVYLKTYPLQVVMAELFGLSQPRVNYWLGRLLPVLRDALDELDALPERDPRAFAQAAPPPGEQVRRIIDGTERRRPVPSMIRRVPPRRGAAVRAKARGSRSGRTPNSSRASRRTGKSRCSQWFTRGWLRPKSSAMTTCNG